MAQEVEIIGLKETNEILRQLGPQITADILLPAAAQAARFFERAIIGQIRSKFKVRSGTLINSIDVEPQVRPGRGGGTVLSFKIGLRRRGSTKPEAWYGRVWDQGRGGKPWRHVGRMSRTRQRRFVAGALGLGTNFRGRTKAARERLAQVRGAMQVLGKPMLLRPFMQPAFDATYQRVIDYMVARVRSGIDAVLAARRQVK